jgi:hypothetical protein
MAKRDEHLVLLVEDIDHTIHNVVFECLVLNVYGNSSISSTSPFKFVAFSYPHAYAIDIVGTTIITVNIKGCLIKTHVEFIKKGFFLWLKNFFVKAKTNYDKGDFDWTIEISTTIKMKTIPTFDCPMKLHFLPKDTIHNFLTTCSNHLLQPPLFLLLLECTVTLIVSLNY